MPDPLILISEAFSIIWFVFAGLWWFIAPVLLLMIFLPLWKFYVQAHYVANIEWTLLEVKIPKNIARTPKAMEQVFAALHSTYHYDMKILEAWWDGVVQPWTSLEIVGQSGSVSFYARVFSRFRNLLEAAIYAQYPGAEIREAPDYIGNLPERLPNEKYDLFGSNFILRTDDGYPIRTYEYFEDIEDERRLDPIAAITEAMSKLKEGETIWLQILVSPVLDEWKKKAEMLINKLIGAKEKPKASLFGEFMAGFSNVFSGEPAVPEKKQPEDQPNKIRFMTQGQRDVVQAIEEKIAKIGFRSNIRFVYIDKRDSFSKANVSAVIGALAQFNTQNLNALRIDGKTLTKGKFPMKARRALMRKVTLYDDYRSRDFAVRSSVFNTEELATLYHYPTLVVEAPKLQRIEAKKKEPPANLPIE